MKNRFWTMLFISAFLLGCGGNPSPSSSSSKEETSSSQSESSSSSEPSSTSSESSVSPSSSSEPSSEVSSSEAESSEESLSSIESSEYSTEESESSEDSQGFSSSEEEIIVKKEREARVLDDNPTHPENISKEDSFPGLGQGKVSVLIDGLRLTEAGGGSIRFIKNGKGYDMILEADGVEGFRVARPAKGYFRYLNASGQRKSGAAEAQYGAVSKTSYGVLATATLEAPGGSSILIEDKYYLPIKESHAINIERNVIVEELNSNDIGIQTIFAVQTADNGANKEYFVPNCVFGTFTRPSSSQAYQYWKETLVGLPMAMMRDPSTGFTASLARYQPVIDYSTNSYASISLHDGTTSSGDAASSIEVTYPSRDTARFYLTPAQGARFVHTLTLQLSITEDFDQAMIDSYTRQYSLEDPRIVDTDIDEVFNVINEDFKTFMLSTTGNGMTSYGLPWRVTIENGKIGPKSYQAGFVGQQIPCAYHMIHYGVRNKDSISLQNGINILNFWVNSAKMMTSAGVPKVWFDGVSNRWAGYPTFLRMAVDSMEGLLDGYRVCERHKKGLESDRESWLAAVKACADWLVDCQNSDGSWYRCYNYEGTYYKGDSDAYQGIGWNPGDICRSTSKNNTPMPIRFLGKMYQMTGEEKYKSACLKAGEFTMKYLYPKHYYQGGTCDNPDAIDKEAGVFAMYGFDTLYMMTGEARYLKALEQATAFTMSTVIVPSFKINKQASDLRAAASLKYGYSDGLSFIVCNGAPVDNFAAFIYYELFRTYILTGKHVYFEMAEFIQQNTKSTMDWDGVLGYAYRSLTPEASTIWSFGYQSATDDDGVQGVWLPWQSDANAEPISKMYDNFGVADVDRLREVGLDELRASLDDFGYGGGAHRLYISL